MIDLYHIKARRKGERTFHFLAGNGNTTRLRVHAVQYSSERVGTVLAAVRSANPDLEFVTRPVRGGFTCP